MEYLCTLRHGSSREQWIGKLTLLQKRPGLYEAEISGRGTYFHVLTGRHKYGNYLCIPNHDIGCELSDEYSCAMKSHFRKSGNQMSGKWKSSYASLLA